MQWLRSPTTTIAFFVIFAGLIGMVLYDPPKSTCDAEVDNFRAGMVGFFSVDAKSYSKEMPYFHMKDNCIRANGPGGCLEYFSGLRKMLLQLSSVSDQCLPVVGELNEVRGSLKTGLDLMIRMAWGAAPPSHPNLKVGWFDPGDLSLFCRLRASVINMYGNEKWTAFQNSYFSSLPGATLIPRAEAWDKSLLSVQCSQYL